MYTPLSNKAIIKKQTLHKLRTRRSVFSHREPAADVSNEEEGVVFEVAHHGVTAAKLRGATITFVVVADGAVSYHGQDEGEDSLVVTVGNGGERRKLNQPVIMCCYYTERWW